MVLLLSFLKALDKALIRDFLKSKDLHHSFLYVC